MLHDDVQLLFRVSTSIYSSLEVDFGHWTLRERKVKVNKRHLKFSQTIALKSLCHCTESRGPVSPVSLRVCNLDADASHLSPPFSFSSFNQAWRPLNCGTWNLEANDHLTISHPSRTSGGLSRRSTQPQTMDHRLRQWRRAHIVVVAEPSGGRYMTGDENQ